MNSFEIRGQLLRRGYTLRKWAIEKGYAPNTVVQTIDRYTRPDHKPQLRGITTRSILVDLSRTIGKPVIPGLPLDSTRQS